MKIIVASGGFDPLHSGHIAYLNEASKLGDKLLVGVNSDPWLARKKGRAFMPYDERAEIINNIKSVDLVYGFDDSDGSACELLRDIQQEYPSDEIIFANGGDRTSTNIPEMNVLGGRIKCIFGVGGNDKKNSSSTILKGWDKQYKDTRWGYWEVLDNEFTQAKMKKLVVKPGGCLSYQRHQHRNEHWFVVDGKGKVITRKDMTETINRLTRFDMIQIPQMSWHQLINDSRDEDLVIYEIQYGEKCVEEDIESE